jgi:glycerol-3-phosphate dehydrogenase
MSSALNAERRSRELDALARHAVVDVLVIGGGITGVGVALDAAARGLSVVLAERRDLAFGTSRWSSKLVHGGLRYLATGAVGIAHESAVERGILMTRTAPHLVRPMPQVVPMLPAVSRPAGALIRTGLLAGDALRIAARTPSVVLPRSRRIDAAEVARYAPTVRRSGLRGGTLAWDGQLCDDARLVVTVARTAAAHGAVILTRCEATDVSGRGAVLRDTRSGERIAVDARMVINAAGVWSSELTPGLRLRPSRGAHLVFSQRTFGGLTAGLTVPVPGSTSRFCFALPASDRRVYVGITDEEAPGDVPDVPQPTEAEVDFLLDTVSAALDTPLTRADVRGRYAGLRPLLDTGDAGTADLSRKHAVLTASDGLVTVVGGKLTTYRRMAQDAVDAAVAAAPAGAPGATHAVAGPCRTAHLPLLGAPDGAAGRAAPTTARLPTHLWRRYGTLAEDVAAAGSLDPVAAGLDTTHAEFRYAVTHEGALDVEDILDRRTRVGLVPADADAARAAAEAALAEAGAG